MRGELGEKGITVSAAVVVSVIVTAIIVGSAVYVAKPTEEKEVTVEQKVTLGFVLGGYISGSTWDGRMIVSAERLKTMYDWFDYAYDEGVVVEGREVPSSGRDLIVTMDADIVEGSWEAAAVPGLKGIADEYPDLYFLGVIGSDVTTERNFLRHFPRQYQVMYLEGLVAGALTETDKIGATVGPVNVQNYRRMAAFYLGIKEVNPDATLYIKYVGTWYDPDTEREVSTSLVDDIGVDVLTNYTDSTAPVKVCEEKGVWYVGKDTDVVSIGNEATLMDIIGAEPWSTTDTVAIAFDTRWEVIWDHYLKEYLAGVEDPDRLMFFGMDEYIAVPADNPILPGETVIPAVDLQNNGKIGVEAISPAADISADVKDLIENRREQMLKGVWDPFFEYAFVSSGEGVEIPGLPIPAAGTVVKPAGVMPTDEFLLGQLNFQLEGIELVE